MRGPRSSWAALFCAAGLACGPRALPSPPPPSSASTATATPSGTLIALKPAPTAPADGLVYELHPLPARAIAAEPSGVRRPSAEELAKLLALYPTPPPTALSAGSTLSFTPIKERPSDSLSGGPRVLQYAPAGEVEGAQRLTVVFSEPMQLGQRISLEPEPPGRWRWVAGTTLIFEPEGGFPLGTDYRVEVPAGLLTQRGGRLLAPVRFAFGTPGPTLLEGPSGALSWQPRLRLRFDQPVNTATVRALAQLLGPNGPVPLELLSPKQNQAEVELIPSVPLQPDSRYRLVIQAGLPWPASKRRTLQPWERSFRTRAPLHLLRTTCRAVDGCPAGAPLELVFDRPLDPASWAETRLRIEPPIEDLSVTLEGDGVLLEGATLPKTRYRLELSGGLRDRDGDGLLRPIRTEWNTTSVPPSLSAEGRNLVFLPADGPPTFVVHSVNYGQLVVTVHRVRPEDWPAYLRFISRPAAKDGLARLPGTKVYEAQVQVEEAADQVVATAIDLSPALSSSVGHAIVEVRPARRAVERWQRNRPPAIRRWIEVTRLGLDAHVGPSSALCWATDLSTGRVLPDLAVSLWPGGAEARTQADGTATLSLPGPGHPPGAEVVLLAERGADRAFLPESRWYQGQSRWTARPSLASTRFWVLDPQGRYAPGAELQLLGWARRLEGGPGGDLVALPLGQRAHYRLSDSAGVRLFEGEVELSAQGSFVLRHPIPEDAQAGPARLEVGLDRRRSDYAKMISIEKAPPNGAQLRLETSSREAVLGEAPTWSALDLGPDQAPVPDAELRWRASTQDARFRPARLDSFSFGRFTPWWQTQASAPGPPRARSEPIASGRTDDQGRAELAVELLGITPPRPVWLELEASDAQRGARARRALLVHPADRYPGLRAGSAFVRPEEGIEVELLVVGLDGRPIAGQPVTLTATRLAWTQAASSWRQLETPVEQRQLRSEDGPLRVVFGPGKGGAYRIRARLEDERGRPNESELLVEVAGGDSRPRNLEEDRVELIPDRRRYQGGDQAEILVESPFHPAEALLTVARSGLVSTRQFRIDGPSHLLRLKLGPALAPNVHLSLEVVGNVDRDGARRPAHAIGTLILPIRPEARTLSVELQTQADQLELRVAAKGTPVPGAEIWVLSLDARSPPLRRPDLLDAFYAPRSAGVQDLYARSDLYEGRRVISAELPMALPDSSAAMRLESVLDEPNRDRAVGEPRLLALERVVTDAEGIARLTTGAPTHPLQLLALASDGSGRFGAGELRVPGPGAPRLTVDGPSFLRPGDQASLSVRTEGLLGPALVAVTEQLPDSARLLSRPRGRAPLAAVPPPQTVVLVQGEAQVETQLWIPLIEPHTWMGQEARASLSAGEEKSFGLPSFAKAGDRVTIELLPPGLEGLSELIDPPLPVEMSVSALAHRLRFELAWRGARRSAAPDRDAVLSALTEALRQALSAAPSPAERLLGLEALVQARAAGLPVSEPWLESALAALQGLPSNLSRRHQAQRLRLRARLGTPELAAARRLARSEALDPTTAALLWPLIRGTDSRRAEAQLHQALERLVAGPAAPEPEAAWLEALAGQSPEAPEIQVLLDRLRPRTLSPEDLALAAPAIVMGRRLGAPEIELALSLSTARGAEQAPLSDAFAAPLRVVAPAKVAASGVGRVSLRLRYEPRASDLKAVDGGLVLARSVRLEHHPEADLGALPLGAWLRVRLDLVVSEPQSQVRLEDPWPAGFAPAATSVGPRGPFGTATLGPDRLVLRAERLEPGVYTYEYRVRATNAGRFSAPPAQVQSREGFGMSDGLSVRIE